MVSLESSYSSFKTHPESPLWDTCRRRRPPSHPGPHLPERLEGLGIAGVAAGGGSGSPRMKMGLLGPAEAGLAPSSSDEKANLGIVSRLIVLKRDEGLGPRSGWEDDGQEVPEGAQDLRVLQGKGQSHTWQAPSPQGSQAPLEAIF